MVKLLLEAGADASAQSANLWTPLHFAAKYNSATSINLLLGAGANITALTFEGLTSLHLAARYNSSVAALKALLAAPCCGIEAKDDEEWTPLLLAARYQSAAASVKAMVDAGADLAARSDDGDTVLCLGARGNSPEVLKFLLNTVDGNVLVKDKSEIDFVNVPGSHGWTPLHFAVSYGKEDNVKLLLNYGADIDALDDNGGKPAEVDFVDDVEGSVQRRILRLLKNRATKFAHVLSYT
jgi:uncharacterized protein